jgi:two-component system sensor histidine kinase HupT/HoxJ
VNLQKFIQVISDYGFISTLVVLIGFAYMIWVVLRMKSKSQIHYALLFMMATASIWAIGAFLLKIENLLGYPTSFGFVFLAYVGLILSPVTVIFLGLIFAKTKISFSWTYLLPWVVPLLSIVMLLTNNQHQLFYKYIENAKYIDYNNLTKAIALGSYFAFHALYSYLCITVGMGYLVFFSIKNAGFFSRQSIFLVLGIIISFGYNILLTVQIIQGEFYTNVIAFFFTLLFIYFAILKYDFLNIVPIALQKVVDHISDGFIVIDMDNHIIDFNKPFVSIFENVFKFSRRDNLDEIINRENISDELKSLLVLFKESVARKVPLSYENNLKINNEEKYFSIEITPLFNNNIYLSTIVLMKDISELKKAAATIQRNYEILTENERLASLGQLIGGIAHNLKTPIMSISGGIEGLKDLIEEYDRSIGDASVTNEDHQEIVRDMNEWIDKIKPYCSYMSDIISTVKGQAAQFNATTAMSFTLDELIKRVDLLMKHELKRYHCVLKINYDMDLLLEIKGEVNSLVQIFDNLIINSIHAYEGKTGEIELDIKILGPNIVFILKDYGKGISVPIQEKLFKEMVTTKGKGGTGLGLYMSYATIKGRFKGNMWFDSESGKGTTFYISIPYAQVYTTPSSLKNI